MYLSRAQDLISTAADAYSKNNSISFMQAFIPTSVQKSLGFSVSAASAGGALANNCTKNQFTCMTTVAISLDYMQHYATGNSTLGSQGVKYVLGKMGLPLTDGQAEQAYGTILAAGGTAALLRQSASVNGRNIVVENKVYLPQGLSQSQFDKFSHAIKDTMQAENLPLGETFIHGSRANGTAKHGISDIDVVHVVSDEQFAALLAKRLEETTGRNREIIEKNAAFQQRISARGISRTFESNLWKDVYQSLPTADVTKIQFSIVTKSSPFNKGPFIPLGGK